MLTKVAHAVKYGLITNTDVELFICSWVDVNQRNESVKYCMREQGRATEDSGKKEFWKSSNEKES